MTATPGRQRRAAMCSHCGEAVHVDIVEKVAVQHLAGQELPPVLRFQSYCANKYCWAYRQPQEMPTRS